MSELTKAAVKKALAGPIIELDDGRVQCPLCDFIARARGTLGPHMLKHRRAVGLAPPRADTPRARPGTNGVRPTTPLHCTVCPSTVQSMNYGRHLRQVHPELTPRQRGDAIAVARAAVTGEPVPGASLAVVEPNGEEPEPESMLSDVSGVEFATGLLVTARRDGLMPVRLLPRVTEWIVYTDDLLAELARLSQ